MKTITRETPITLEELRSMAAGGFGDLVKAVVDVRRGLMVVDADLHSDQEAELLASGSQQWPSFGNRSREVDDAGTKERISALVAELVRR
jgi:hypothetical protein